MNSPFDRLIINPLERPVCDDVNQAESQLDYSLREVVARALATRTSNSNYGAAPLNGFLGESFRPCAASPADGTVVLKAGLGFMTDADASVAIGGVLGLDDRSHLKPMVLLSDLAVPVAAPPGGGNARIDIIEIRWKRTVTDPLSKDVFNTVLGEFVAGLQNKTMSFVLSNTDITYNGAGAINYKTGTPGIAPTAPAVDAGYIAVANILVDSAAVTFANIKIADMRTVLGGVLKAAVQLTVRANGTLDPASLRIMGPAGVPIYVSTSGIYFADIFVLGNFKAVVATIGNSNTQNKTVGLVIAPGADAPTTTFRTGVAGHINSASCLNEDLDPPGTPLWRINLYTAQQRQVAVYDFSDPLGVPENVNVEIMMAY